MTFETSAGEIRGWKQFPWCEYVICFESRRFLGEKYQLDARWNSGSRKRVSKIKVGADMAVWCSLRRKLVCIKMATEATGGRWLNSSSTPELPLWRRMCHPVSSCIESRADLAHASRLDPLESRQQATKKFDQFPCHRIQIGWGIARIGRGLGFHSPLHSIHWRLEGDSGTSHYGCRGR